MYLGHISPPLFLWLFCPVPTADAIRPIDNHAQKEEEKEEKEADSASAATGAAATWKVTLATCPPERKEEEEI